MAGFITFCLILFSGRAWGSASTRGDRTPGMHMTPMHGSRTPMYGSQTPLYDGSRTPYHGSQTPQHDGSMTPGRSSAWDPTNSNTPSRYVYIQSGVYRFNTSNQNNLNVFRFILIKMPWKTTLKNLLFRK